MSDIKQMKHPKVILASLPSDSHTWNLVYLELLMKEKNIDVLNLGCCVPNHEIIQSIVIKKPHLIVISSVNGHGYSEGCGLIESINKEIEDNLPPIIIGGKLGIHGDENISLSKDLLKKGFDRVFDESRSISEFENYLYDLFYIEQSEQEIALYR